LGLARTPNLNAAFVTIAHQLEAVGMLPAAHMAYVDVEKGWVTERPRPEPCNFGKHADDFCEWMKNPQPADVQRAGELLDMAIKMGANLKARQTPPGTP
jgi:hypothetical protein